MRRPTVRAASASSVGITKILAASSLPGPTSFAHGRDVVGGEPVEDRAVGLLAGERAASRAQRAEQDLAAASPAAAPSGSRGR